ncbi:GGDEF domain-containing protein [Colwellia sp. MB02u-10]|uniref:GGDEF domain-containing protein n=1 Tax=Colwellia sp. MB02u-10 TaxID=2759828 RepID=UPI0015F37303|nr:GGDEF domain-containing protein [Colwellia sp. MB02u-10]MBA6340812.1 GGDEF domain-containing protein [Colwellia sp. MB02u-10]
MNKCSRLTGLALYLLMIFISTAVNADEITGQQEVFNQLNSLYYKQQRPLVFFAINSEILALNSLSVHDKVAAQVKLLAWQKLSPTLNAAEQYLLYVVRANIADVAGQEYKVINWLNKAFKLEPLLAKKQLDSPLFASAYLTLANLYASQGEDKKAFDSKKQYMKKHFSHLKQQKEYRVKRLNEKYHIEKKHEENELLTQNSQIQYFALARAESERSKQHRNIAIFIAVGSIFLLLLLRQFKIRQALKLLAKTDSLTLLPNRRSFFSHGATFMTQALTANKALSILMLDIDNLKNINDNFGYEAGDSVIAHVGELAGETMRSRDFLARIGGEEFAAILPEATIAQARAIAEHIREKIQANISKNQNNNIQVTVSIGIASIADIRESFDSLLHAADLAMYQAKAYGHNQVCSYSTERKERTEN